MLISNMAIAMENGDLLLRKGQVGKINIGAQFESVDSLYGKKLLKKTTKVAEGDKYTIIEIYFSEADMKGTGAALIIEEGKGKVWRIEVKSSKFKTEKGIGIGSTVKELEEKYGKLKFEEGAEMGPIYAIVDKVKMSFALSIMSPMPKSISPDAKVTSILVY
jgi:hypothetical protein